MVSLELAGFVALSVVLVLEFVRGGSPFEEHVSALFVALAAIGITWYGVRVIYADSRVLEDNLWYFALTAAFAVVAAAAAVALARDQYEEWVTSSLRELDVEEGGGD